MIFVTVGTQLPFARLIDAMNQIAGRFPDTIRAQTGAVGHWPNLEAVPTMNTDVFDAVCRQAKVIVAHAGIGTILSARKYEKPLIIVPRRASLGEHRNDHQMATARQMENRDGIHVAWHTDQIEALLAKDSLSPACNTPGPTYPDLVSTVRSFIG